MKLITGQNARDIRWRFVDIFIDIQSEFYIERIVNANKERDDPILWEKLKAFNNISEQESFEKIRQKQAWFVFWDFLDWDDAETYVDYPSKSVIEMTPDEFDVFDKKCDAHQMADIYLVDKDFTVMVSLTHEWDMNGDRVCFYLNVNQCN